ncbi:MAG: nitronate monooxygenase, partial [Mycobacterium sp.]
MFDLDAPLMLAPMSAHTGATIAAAVSSGGALGSFGGLAAKEPDWISAEISSIRTATDRPFAVGFVTQAIPWVLPLFETVLVERVPAVQTLEDADLAVDVGADILITQGNAAGGHTGTMS